jgi:hypothetical protein
MKKILLSILVSTVILFIWNGLSQAFPWGVPSTQMLSTKNNLTADDAKMGKLQSFSANTFTTEKFDERFNNKVSTLVTDQSFSWIISKPIAYYDMGAYFMKEILTQLLVAIFLSLILFYTIMLNLKTRLSIIGLAGLAAAIGAYGQLMNWWGLPAIYGLGVGFNIVVSWLIASFISAKWIIKST